RVEDEQALVGEERAEQAREGVAEAAARRVMRGEQRRDLGAGGTAADGLTHRLDGVGDVGAEQRLGDGRARVGARIGGDAQAQRRLAAARDAAVVDLGEVGILGRHPEDGDDRSAGLDGERFREHDRGRRFIDGVERAEEQADLLPGDDDGGARLAQVLERAAPRRAIGQERLLRGELGEQRRRRRAGRGARDRLFARLPIAEPRRKERAGRQTAFDVRRKQRAGHRFYMTMYGTMQLAHMSLVVVAVTLMTTSGFAANTKQPSAGELMRALDRLGVVGNVLYVAAHPDDENTRLLAWLANDKLVRAGYLSLTRGEGGQNLIGAEQAPLLGLIRTEELLAARGIDRAEQWFSRARDFGYSKTPEETLRIWDREAIASDVVTVMKKFRPDVVITRFPPEAGETHGHHTASAMLAVEAWHKLDAASRPKRVVWNRFNFGGPPPAGEELTQLSKLDVGGYNPLLGISYGEMAAQSRSMHKSQGFGVAPSRGEQTEYFRVLAGDPVSHSIFDGIDLTWGRVPGGKKIGEHIARIRAAFSPTAPAHSIPELVALRGEMQ